MGPHFPPPRKADIAARDHAPWRSASSPGEPCPIVPAAQAPREPGPSLAYIVSMRATARSASTSFLLIAACATTPTGRKQLELLPDDQLAQMGSDAFVQMKQKEPVSRDSEVTAYVRCIADEVIEANQRRLKTKTWDVEVFASDQINAFALPGGHIGVYQGMVEFAENQDQLAAVIAHEVAHVLADHGNARASEQLAAQGVLGAVSALTDMDGMTQGLVLGALGLGYTVGIQLPHSREQEAEADELGMTMMAEAGFDPRGAVRLWERMSQLGGERPPQFLSTHPHPESRVRSLSEQLEKAMPKYQEAVEAGRAARCQSPANLSSPDEQESGKIGFAMYQARDPAR